MEREIQRIDGYDDSRFSLRVLRQHGAFLVDGEPYEVEITGKDQAEVRGTSSKLYTEVVENFRFYAEHICRFYSSTGKLVQEYPPVKLFAVKLETVQPSQFYVDAEKLAAVCTFVHKPEDIVIPVTWDGKKYISQDGHTRLAAAVGLGFDKVNAFTAETNDYIFGFAQEAQKRGVFSPFDLKVIPHEEYEVKWNRFCDEYFQRMQGDTE